MEIWKEIIYAPNYEVSNLGNIKNKTTKRVKKLNYERMKKTNRSIILLLIESWGISAQSTTYQVKTSLQESEQ